ncbi:pyridoxal-dependent decarboxylase [Candidatus Viadribacter manganicus]|uniref:Pyridoxal-dependent decarboxylase n=1 Tax=Candidatus Viadribacter manganicus TaxID=1759059 RepID=A0A1B1AN69_9PROT|nr:pyridoxal-dependent decarboxylase [Candidatus Viadribacter manganicus]
MRAVLHDVAERAASFRESRAEAPARPLKSYAELQTAFEAPTPEHGAPIGELILELATLTEAGLANMVGPRFFGWVIGATEPAGMAADWLTSAWAQNVGNAHATPAASACEERVGAWLLDLLDLPRESSVGFVTGATLANFTCLAAARGEVLRRAGWDAEADGLFGAPPVHVVLGEEAHSTVFSGLRYLGLGAKRVVSVPVNEQGLMKPGAFAKAVEKLDGPIIAIAQAGHINSGGFDPFEEIAAAAHEKGAWLHVDGAFGLWARACPDRAHLSRGLQLADSWGVDGHKWLQTPHDSAYAVVRNAEAHRRAMLIAASYLPAGVERHPADFVPELSRRGRAFATWAMIKSLGREGIATMVARHCAQARRMAERLGKEPGIEIMNDVVLNQVAVRLGANLDGAEADALTDRTIARIQNDGVCFVGGANWRGRQIIRVSVISANTTDDDIDRSAEAILSAWRAELHANA